MSRLIDLLKKQRKLELSHVEKIKPDVEAVPNRLVSAMLESIVHDSLKHAALCQALVDVEAGAVPFRLDTDIATALKMAQAIKQHIRAEADMIKQLKSMLEKVEDDRVADILRNILADERRHHTLLTRMATLLDRDETAYDEYLELAQKYMFVPPER
jgi:rubrerythrin